jgi:D-alanyl-D-alanine dipeptidase
VAVALKQVQADLAASGLALKVYDCYRPQRAVRTMVQWAHDGSDANKRYFPRLPKARLFALGYIAGLSRHSTGTAVDVSLIELSRPSAPAPRFDPAARYGPCNGPAQARAPDDSLDMGTGYDCFDVDSSTRAALDPAQRQRRGLLVAAMTRRGFRNYHREWWHFSFSVSPPPAHYDFPIPARRAKASAAHRG